MGQAKQRGDFKKRKDEAIERNKIAEEAEEARRAAAETAMSPEERKKRSKAKMTVNLLTTLAATSLIK